MALKHVVVTAATLAALFAASVGAGAQGPGRSSTVQVGVAAAYPAPVPSPASASPLQLRLTVHRLMAPAFVSGLVLVAPDTANRMLRVVLDSDNFYRSSDVQLDGELSPRSHFFRWPALPPGEYRVVVIVFDAGGRRTQVSRLMHVMGNEP